MSKKNLNKDNLTALGAEGLADLLLEVNTGSADIKRRLRLELSHSVGATELTRDARKRLVSLRNSTSFVGWRKRKSLIKDLNTQLDIPQCWIERLKQRTTLRRGLHDQKSTHCPGHGDKHCSTLECAKLRNLKFTRTMGHIWILGGPQPRDGHDWKL